MEGKENPGTPAPREEETGAPQEPPRKPYSKKARALAWAGIAFMVFLTVMYFYVFYSGKILRW